MFKFKKILSLFLISILLAVSAVGNLNLKVSAATVTTAYIEGTNVNVRQGPYIEATIIEKIGNTSADVVSSVTNSGGTWYQITYHNGTKQITGYIFYNPEYIRIVSYNPDASFEEKLKAFPESYRDALRALKAEYPNWEFIPDPVTITFEEAVAMQSIDMRKQVSFSSQPVSWRSMGRGAYEWGKKSWVVTNDGWTGASREITAYYMDPRNFLNKNEIYQFLQQGYDAKYQNEEGVKKILAGTFMETNYSDPNDTAYGGSYSKVIMAAAKESGVSPYILASKIKQEIGTKVSSMVSGTYPGYEGYYNFYNINASGSNAAQIIANGLTRAKNEGWNSRSKAIIGGAKFLSDGYISVGQDTYFYQDFNVHNPGKLWHQYAQAIHDAYSKGKLMAKSYVDEKNYALSFRIPVYTNMPETVSEKPVSNSKKNNYYFEDISVSGLTPSFTKFTYDYDLRLTGNATIYVKPIDTATYVGKSSYSIKKGTNKIILQVKSETGYITDYTVNVDSTVNCTVTVKVGNAPADTQPSTPTPTPSTPPTVQPSVKRGDANCDGKITISDIGIIQWHLLDNKRYPLDGDNKTGADVNKDGKITISDIGTIIWHLLDSAKYPL